MPQPTTTGQKALDVLPTLLHTVFVQTANVFNDPRKLNPRAVVNTNAMIRVGIPVLIDRFQMALDCLEVDILRAKATFRRDLEVLRQRAEEEAKAQGVEENRTKGLTEEKTTQGQDEKETREKVGAD
ncbi:hypothetical protein EV426DRAFT_596305 [Tirmania nivea]|nr:hypothetical protein EV426DRAFT_596305 [Tirmania nivea]